MKATVERQENEGMFQGMLKARFIRTVIFAALLFCAVFSAKDVEASTTLTTGDYVWGEGELTLENGGFLIEGNVTIDAVGKDIDGTSFVVDKDTIPNIFPRLNPDAPLDANDPIYQATLFMVQEGGTLTLNGGTFHDFTDTGIVCVSGGGQAVVNETVMRDNRFETSEVVYSTTRKHILLQAMVWGGENSSVTLNSVTIDKTINHIKGVSGLGILVNVTSASSLEINGGHYTNTLSDAISSMKIFSQRSPIAIKNTNAEIQDAQIDGNTLSGDECNAVVLLLLYGGGINFTSDGTHTLSLTNCTLNKNTLRKKEGTTCIGQGGALYLYGAKSVTIRDTTLSGNTNSCDSSYTNGTLSIASMGGAIYASNVGTLSLSGTTVLDDNTAEGNGGAIAAIEGTLLTCMDGNVNFHRNKSNADGGAISNDGTSVLCVNHGIFSGNTAVGYGGALSVGGILSIIGEDEIENRQFQNNTAKYGGAIAIHDNSLFSSIISNCLIGTRTDSDGDGDIDAADGGNHAESGGGIYASKASPLTIYGSVIGGNEATGISDTPWKTDSCGVGGGVALLATDAEFSDNTEISHNTAYADGGGVAAGNYYFAFSRVTMEDTTISYNRTTGSFPADKAALASPRGGAGVYVGGEDSVLTLNNGVNLEGNTSSAFGGGLLADGIKLTMKDEVLLRGNKSRGGGGLAICSAPADQLSVMADTSISGNEVFQTGASADTALYGGGMLLYNVSGLQMKNVAISNNSCTGDTVSETAKKLGKESGGGLYVYYKSYSDTANLVLDNCTVEANQAAYRGGGMMLEEDDLTKCNVKLTGGAIRSNKTLSETASDADGGGLYVTGNYEVGASDGLTVTLNQAAGSGGGICALQNLGITAKDTSIIGNTAQENGGGLYTDSPQTLSLSGNMMLVQNSAKKNGGALALAGTSRLMQSAGTYTFGRNTAGGDGGAVYVADTAMLNVTQANFVQNRASGYGGALCARGLISLSGAEEDALKFAGNEAQYGGAIAVKDNASPYLTFENLSIYGNMAIAEGGGMWTNEAVHLRGNISIEKNGVTGVRGGGLYLAEGIPASIQDSVKIRDNMMHVDTVDAENAENPFIFVADGGYTVQNSRNNTYLSYKSDDNCAVLIAEDELAADCAIGVTSAKPAVGRLCVKPDGDTVTALEETWCTYFTHDACENGVTSMSIEADDTAAGNYVLSVAPRVEFSLSGTEEYQTVILPYGGVSKEQLAFALTVGDSAVSASDSRRNNVSFTTELVGSFGKRTAAQVATIANGGMATAGYSGIVKVTAHYGDVSSENHIYLVVPGDLNKSGTIELDDAVQMAAILRDESVADDFDVTDGSVKIGGVCLADMNNLPGVDVDDIVKVVSMIRGISDYYNGPTNK